MAQELAEYPLNNDEEIKRLTYQHEVIKDALGGKLLLVPVDTEQKPLRILDSATADGLWIRDLASSSVFAADTTFIGTDINPQFLPKEPPAGIKFAVQDINKPWPKGWHGSFDIVHQRLGLAGCGSHQQEAINSLAGLVKPGGWIQLVEGENVADDSDGPAMKELVQLLRDMYSNFGAELVFTHTLSRWLTEAGFVDVKDKRVDCLMGASNKNPELAKKGLYSTTTAMKGLVNFARTLPSLPNFSKEQIDTLVSRLAKELEERGGNYRFLIAWGRKP